MKVVSYFYSLTAILCYISVSISTTADTTIKCLYRYRCHLQTLAYASQRMLQELSLSGNILLRFLTIQYHHSVVKLLNILPDVPLN